LAVFKSICMLKLDKLTIRELLVKGAKEYGENICIAFVDGTPLTYNEMIGRVLRLQTDLRSLGICRNDKVALLGQNMPNWVIAYLAITSMGAIVVPILPDSLPAEVQHILEHSESKLLIISERQISRIESIETTKIQHRIQLDNLFLLPVSDAAYKPELSQESYDLSNIEKLLPDIIQEEDTAAIIYTSGTTGSSKGVMLSHRNILFDAEQGFSVHHLNSNDVLLSILPLAHTYENTIGMIMPFMGGSSIYYLEKLPTASVLLPALKKIRPTCMLSVPLVIEKLYKNKIVHDLNQNMVLRVIYPLMPFRRLLNWLIGRKLRRAFGGRLQFFGIGGAKLDGQVEQFLREARFPFAIGYGLTETSPLIAGGKRKNIRFQSTGPVLPDVTLKLDYSDPVTGEGEIVIKGANVMKGYFKNPELTKETLNPEGWFRTGDLGFIDKKQNLHIRGRVKNLIVGANGINIYPEEIESIINSFRNVVESIVVEKKGKLIALVHLNNEELEKQFQAWLYETRQAQKDAVATLQEFIDQQLLELKMYVNARVNKYSQVQFVINYVQPFEKTATQKIKRFLYI